MAILTDVGRGQVIEAFAARRDAVMTAEAAGDDPRMVENPHRPERNGQVAGIAGITGRRMICGFSRCSPIVVATDATADRFDMIHALNRHECPGCMTGLAGLGTEYVTRGLGCRLHQGSLLVTIGAPSRRALEYAPAMAATAGRNEVCAVKSKSRGIVIEVRMDGGLWQRNTGNQQKTDAERQAQQGLQAQQQDKVC